MDLSLERDGSGLGSLFQQIINDMKNTSPIWDDFVAKASKLHACLRAAIQAIAAYLDAFQKIADAATNSRGASKEIGTALTRVCLRHKAVETRLKTFTTAIMDCLVQPLQEKLEDWKRSVASIDKDHAKEYKRCRTELKKRSSDTLRLQKKARKGQSDVIQSQMETYMQDVTLRRAELEEVEKKSLRSAMIEERLRYCTFVHMLQPVVKEECEVMSELGHLQEAMESIANATKEPNLLPPAYEELIHDAKAAMSLYPESPGACSGSQGACSNSLGSRKSSVCSISSINSSGSSGSPGHHHYQRSLSQLITPAIRLKPGESSDSGFCSSPALTAQASAATNQTHGVSTWPPHSQDGVALPPTAERPHTISTAYEKGHQRTPLTVYTFQNPETIMEGGPNGGGNGSISTSGQNTPVTQKSPAAAALNRPPLPVRCSSLERPLSANANRNGGANLLQRQCPSPIPAHITKELSAHHAQQQQQQQQQLQSPPTYVNMSELANMAALKITNQRQQQQPQTQTPLLQQQHSIDSISSQLSNDSAASNTQQPQSRPHTGSNKTTRSHSTTSSTTSSNTPSLYSHHSMESTVATPLVGQTPTPSSGSSTPQNHYSPLLTNSPSSTAAGTPSGASITSGMTGAGFVCNVSSPTPPPSIASDILKITEMEGGGAGSDSNGGTQNSTTPTNDTANAHSVAGKAPIVSLDDAANLKRDTNSAVDTDSPTIIENDERSRASVLQKASMFEKQAAVASAAAVSSMPPTSVVRTPVDATIYSTRRSDRTTPTALQQQFNEAQSQLEQHDMGGGGGTTRIARRSSVNAAKPPPPVRRSSSVTPSHNVSTGPTQKPQSLQTLANASNLSQQCKNTINNSTENLPPPPAYLLDAVIKNQTTMLIPNSSLKVAETVKALSAMRHQPASPNTLRRIQQQQQQQPVLQSFRTSSPGIYAQPKIVNNMSSFRSASPGPNGHQHQVPPAQPKTNPNLIAQLNARLSKQQQQLNAAESIYSSSPNSPNHHHPHQQQQQQQQQQRNDAIYIRNYGSQQQVPPSQQQQQYNDDYASTNCDKSGSIRAKTKAEFLENLNAKLAKQGISGRAYAVRNLINSKASPDPRLCHESLMDQIKRGATLKRNQKINDRSAPKIH